MNAQGTDASLPVPVWLRNGSGSARFGFKGAGAPAWCEAQGFPLPAAPNTAAWLDGGEGWVGRLAYTEFYLEHSDKALVDALRDTLGSGARSAGGGVYPVHRRDACILLGGPAAPDVFLQICNVNMAALDLAASPLIMTLVVGVAVLVLPRIEGGQPAYRLVFDPTFAPYLWSTLREIVTELGGDVDAGQIPFDEKPTHPLGTTRTS